MKLHDIHERKRAETWIAYHGTSESLLRSIMQRGLIPSPEKRVWQDDPDASWGQASRQSVGGIYFTTNVMTALSSGRTAARKFEGSSAIVVIAEIQPRTAAADEDDFSAAIDHSISRGFGEGLLANDSNITYLYGCMLIDDPHGEVGSFVQNATAAFLEYIQMDWMMGELHPALERKVRDFMPKLVKAEITRRTSYVNDKGYFGSYRQSMSQVRDAPWEWDDIPTKPESSPAEQEVLTLKNELTRMLRRIVWAGKKDGNRKTFRIDQPVGFHGRNRIIGIVEEGDRDGDYKQPTPLIVHYGEIPDDFLRQFQERVGSYKVTKPARSAAELIQQMGSDEV